VRITRLIVIACVLFALVVPLQALAQSAYYGDVKGTVYSQAFRAPGVKVTLYTMDPVSHMPVDEKATATTDSNGEFNFQYAVFQPGAQFQYQVRAQRGSDAAFAWVFALPAEDIDTPVYVAPINMDLSAPSGNGEVTVSVMSTQGQVTSHSNLALVPGVKLTLYSVDPASGNRTVIVDNKLTNAGGQGVYSNIPYGTYVVRAEKSGQYGEQNFAVYQQITSTILSANLPLPSPTPTPAPTATPGPSSTTPGFEAFVALIALLGGALYLRRA
jgi:PGF-CTERM protein